MSSSNASVAAPGRQLPTIPTLSDGDSLSGAVGRLATVFNLRRPEALRAAGWFQALPAHRIHLPRLDIDDLGTFAPVLAANLGLTLAQLNRLRLADPAPARGAWVHRAATPVCPVCLIERPGAHQLIWRHALVPVCLRHEVTLVSHCPRCDRVPYLPDPIEPRPYTRPGRSDAPLCRCGATATGLLAAQRPARPAEVRAAQTMAAVLLPNTGPAQPQHAERVRRVLVAQLQLNPALTDLLSDPAQSDLARRAAMSRGRRVHAPLGATATAELLPQVIEAVRSHVHRDAVLAPRPIPRSTTPSVWPASVATRPYLLTGQRWAELLPAIERPASFQARHLPPLLPLSRIAPDVADLLADAHHAYRNGEHTRAPLGLTAMRRALSVLVASCLWHQSLAASARQLDARSATADLGAIRDGAVRLDRQDDLTAALAATVHSLLEAPRIDYAARRLSIPPPVGWLAQMEDHGIPAGTATAWYLEHHACVDPGRHGWPPHRCLNALGEYDLDDLAATAAATGLNDLRGSGV